MITSPLVLSTEHHHADVSCRLAEFDFSGIEAKLSGAYLHWHGIDSLGAPQYIRLAALGIHAAVTSLKVGEPVDLTKDDKTVKAALTDIKTRYPKDYDTAKRTVHANNFGMTVYGMVEKFPEFFPTLKAAQEFQNYYYALAPGLPNWHRALRKQAREKGKLGGRPLAGEPVSIWHHPYGYQHWFWDVLNYSPTSEFTATRWQAKDAVTGQYLDPGKANRIIYMHGRPYKVNFGNDANRVIAYFPQSTAAGRLKEVQAYENGLFHPDSPNYIGDCYFGRTPLLGPIHDSLLLHIPNRCWDRVVEIVARVMQTPSPFLPIPVEWGMGAYLPIGIAAKAGKNWAPRVTEDDQIKLKLKYNVDVPLNVDGMEDIDVPRWVEHAGPDDPVLPRDGDAGDLEDWQALQRRIAA